MKCSVCTHDDAQEFHDLNDLEAHIAAEHFDCLPFECEKCRYSKFPTEFAIRRHFEEDHRMSEYFIRYKQSADLREKLCAVRECLQQSCETASIDFPYTSYPAINNINDAMSAYYARRASYRPSRRPPRSNASSADGAGEPNVRIELGEVIESVSPFRVKCESYDVYSPSNSTEADTPLVGGVAVANGDGPSAALTAFLQNASQVMSGSNHADGDSNNNDEKPNSDDLGAFCSQILQRQHRRGSSVNHHGNEALTNGPDDIDDGGALGGSDIGENADENQGISNQLLQHLSQLQAPKAANMQMRRPNKRLMGKGFNAGMMRHPKRRFGHDSHNVSGSHNFPMQHRHGSQSGAFGSSRNMNHNNVGGGMNGAFPNFFGGMGAPNFGMSNVVPPTAIMSRPAPSRMPSKVNEVQCQECKEMVTNRATSLNYHVNMKHLKFALFICKGCQRNFLWQRTTIVTHVQRYHNGDESLIQDNSSQYMSLINLRRKVYFPTKGPAGATATITNATPITDTSIADTSSIAGTSPAAIGNGGGEYDDSHTNTPIDQTPSTSMSANCGDTGNNIGGQMDMNDQGEDVGSGDGDSADDDDEGEASNGGDIDDDQASELSHNNNSIHHHQNGFGQFGQFHHNNQHHRPNNHHHSSSLVSPPAGGGQQPHNAGHYSHNDANYGFYSGYGMGMYGNGMPPDMMEGDEISSKKGRQLQCQECNEMVVATKPWILLNHANSQHLHFPLFECGACQQVFTKYLRSYTVTHMKRYHDGREDLIIDNRSIYHGQLQAKCQELFGVSV